MCSIVSVYINFISKFTSCSSKYSKQMHNCNEKKIIDIKVLKILVYRKKILKVWNLAVKIKINVYFKLNFFFN